MANLTLVQAINLALIQEMEADPRVLILGEDVGKNGGVFRVTEGLWQRFGGDRVVDSPLAESGIIGTATRPRTRNLRTIMGPVWSAWSRGPGMHTWGGSSSRTRRDSKTM